MSHETVVNFNDIDGAHTEVYDTSVVPDSIWEEFQELTYLAIRTSVPRNQWDRAEQIAGVGNFDRYRASRIDPNILRGDPWNKDQLFVAPLMSATFDSDGDLVSGALTAYNTSAPSIIREQLGEAVSTPVIKAVCWGKMLVPSKRHVHIREVYQHPNAQRDIFNEDDVVVGGFSWVTLYHALSSYSRNANATSYLVRGDPADKMMVDLASAVNMMPTGTQENRLPGYDQEIGVVRASQNIGDILDNMYATPGTSDALAEIQRTRIHKSIFSLTA